MSDHDESHVHFHFDRIEVHVHIDSTSGDLLAAIDERTKQMALDTKKLLQAVADERTELKSWETLAKQQNDTMAKLASDLATAIANSDPAAIAQVQADLDKAATDLSADNAEAAAAILANTPAAP